MGLRDLGINLKMSQRPLEFLFLLDTSAFMAGNKMNAVNMAMKHLGELLQKEAGKNPAVQIYTRILAFGGEKAYWLVEQRTEVEQFRFPTVEKAEGGAPLASALDQLCTVLDREVMPQRGLKPIVVLLSCGHPDSGWQASLDRLKALPWGRKAVKIALAIGKDADTEALAAFTGDARLVLDAANTEEVCKLVKWTSTLVSQTTQYTTKTALDGQQVSPPIQIPHYRDSRSDDPEF